MKRKKNLHVHITLLICVILTSAKVYSTDYTYLTPSLALSNTSGCVTSTYTFSQKTPNNVNAAHNIDNTCTITFPAGTDATTCTGGTFYGTAIGSMTKTSTQISFTIPIAVAKNTTFTIVLNDITNANNNSSPCSISAQNASSGLNTGSYSFSTTSGPSAQATGFTSSAITSSSMTIDWTRGNGSSIIVVARAGSAVNVDPTDGNSYNANTVFGSGSQIGSGNYVVYNGTGTSVNVTGLSASTTYYYAIYEYNSSGYCYNPTELTGNETTSPVSTGGVTLNRPTFVKGTLTLTDGNINTTSANVLTLTSTASSTLGSANSFVNGPMKKEGNTDFVFPVGKGTKWERIGISNLITTSTYTAEYFNSDGITDGNYTSNAINADLTGISAAGYWMLGKTNAEDACGITLHWENASENNINDASLIELRVAHWNSGNSIWEAFDINTGLSTGSTSATSSGSITTNNTHSDFSPFKIGKKVIPTPIELLNFNGACYDKKIVLNWSTASETNNDYFFVERSEDELEFSSIGIISGAGNSNNILTYHFVDESPFSGISYYRLKQTDYDGAYSYSGVVAVNCEKELVSEFSAYGLNDNLSISITVPQSQGYELRLYDETGKLVLNKKIDCIEGLNNYNYNVSFLSTGLYMLVLYNSDEFFKHKILKN